MRATHFIDEMLEFIRSTVNLQKVSQYLSGLYKKVIITSADYLLKVNEH
jgi:hypothetical protein